MSRLLCARRTSLIGIAGRVRFRAWSAAVALVLLGGPCRTPAGGSDSPPAAFAWKSRYSEALEAAREHDLLVAVYFRPVLGVEPPALRLASRTKNLGSIVSGVRVGSEEVVELRKRFAVDGLPALVVLDARETVLMHWVETIPPDVWSRVARKFRELEKRRAKVEETVKAAAELFDSGRPGLAYAELRPVLRSRRVPPQVLRAAKELEARMIEAGEKRLLLVLAADGLVPDDELAKRLRESFPEPMPPELERAFERELRLLETTTVGGR